MSHLKVGAAAVPVRLDESCFPNAESVGLHDDVYIRAVLLESDRRAAFLSADMPSMFANDVRFCRELLERYGVAQKDGWIIVSHSFSAPHTWPTEPEDQKGMHLPAVFQEKPQMMEVARRINARYREAYERAMELAAASLREASVSYAAGECGINVNRNMLTADGWWQGIDPKGFADHHVGVLRFDDQAGDPIAILYNYSIQSSCASGPITEAGRLISADLSGQANHFIEREYPGCVAVHLCGATGDQVPLYKINYTETDKDGKLRKGSLGERGYVLMEEQGRILGGAVIEAARRAQRQPDGPALATAECDYVCPRQKRSSDMSKMRPSLSFRFEPDGEQEIHMEAMLLGDIALVGLLAEMDGRTVAEIRQRSPFEKTMVVTFVNGNGKSMPTAESYDLFQYSAMNSPFAKGSAERTRDTAVELLRRLKEERDCAR